MPASHVAATQRFRSRSITRSGPPVRAASRLRRASEISLSHAGPRSRDPAARLSARAAQPRRAARRAPRHRPRGQHHARTAEDRRDARRARGHLGAGAVLGCRVLRPLRPAVGARRSRARRPTWARRSTPSPSWVMQRGEEFVTADLRDDPRVHGRVGRRGGGVSAELPRPPRRRAHRPRSRRRRRASRGWRRACCARCACCSSRRRSRSTTRCC